MTKNLTNHLVLYKLPYSLFLIIFMLSAMNNTANAIIPASAVSDSLFAKGYLNVIHYGVVANSSGNAASNTTAINQAIQDAYNRENNTAFTGGGGDS